MAGAVKYEDARHIEKKKSGRLNWLKPNYSLKLSWPLLYRARN